jgi:FkbM family methyltransferase
MIVGYEDYKHKYDFSDVRGVIHVGAHHGQEYWEYIQSFGNISTHWFEPLPSAFEILSQRLQKQPNCHLYHCALGASNDEVNIWEDSGNDGQSSSLMKPKEHLSQWSHITFDTTRNVQMRTLDSFVITGSNVLVMDAQGYELEVLKGATETLKMVDHVFCEINSIEMYEGCPTPDEIDAFLVSNGFVMREQWWTDDKWGDGYWYRPATRSFVTEYFPDELRIRLWNQTDEFISLDFSVLCLDTNLCFYKGWATAPVGSFTDIHLPEDYKLGINKLGIRVMLFEKGYLQLIHLDDHYAVDGVPENHFSSDSREYQYGSWYTLEHVNEYEGIFNFGPDDVIYDLGANIGVFTKWVLNQSQIKKAYLFEPTAHLIRHLNSTFGHLENIEIFDKAITSEDKVGVFHTFENSVSNTLWDFDGKNHTYRGTLQVQCVNLEQFIKNNGLLPPTFIKMDIESSEYESLAATSDEFFSTVKQISLEYHDNINDRVMDLVKRFLQLGFKIYLRKGDGISSPSGVLILYK